MKRWLVALWVAAAAGCGQQSTSPSDDGWVQASAALQARGIYTLRAGNEADAQVVWLRGGADQSVGRLDISQASGTSTVALAVYEHSFGQEMTVAQGQMVLSLDGRSSTLHFENGAWQGDADAKSLLADTQSYVELVQLIGVAAQVGVMAPAAGGAASGKTPIVLANPQPNPTPAASGGSGTPPKLACGDLVTTASGWAWYWEANSEVEACKRANDLLAATCESSSGYACCNTPPNNGCISCVNWGSGWGCSTAGYYQYLTE
jgi:hypothetical protein